MSYKLSKEDLLDLCRMMFDASVDNFMDLKEQACEQVVSIFLADKKTCENYTMLSVNQVNQVNPWPNVVYTASDGTIAGGHVSIETGSGTAITLGTQQPERRIHG